MSALTNTFTNIANAIRAKTGGSNQLTPAQMVTEIGTLVYPKAQTFDATVIANAGNTQTQSVTFDNAPTYIVVITKTSTASGLFVDTIGLYNALTSTWTRYTIATSPLRLVEESVAPSGISISSDKKTITHTKTAPSSSSVMFPCTVHGIF